MIYNKIIPDGLEELNISYNDLTTFTSELPESLKWLIIHKNKLTIFTSKLPESLLWLSIQNNNLKKLKLNKVAVRFYYDESIKNKKTFHKSAFYKN